MSRDVMQQALDALRYARKAGDMHSLELKPVDAAITDLRAALAQQDGSDAELAMVVGQRDWAFKQLRAQPAPVAQPLTLAQLNEIWAGGADGQDLYLDTLLVAFARAIERAHKIGGPL